MRNILPYALLFSGLSVAGYAYLEDNISSAANSLSEIFGVSTVSSTEKALKDAAGDCPLLDTPEAVVMLSVGLSGKPFEWENDISDIMKNLMFANMPSSVPVQELKRLWRDVDYLTGSESSKYADVKERYNSEQNTFKKQEIQDEYAQWIKHGASQYSNLGTGDELCAIFMVKLDQYDSYTKSFDLRLIDHRGGDSIGNVGGYVLKIYSPSHYSSDKDFRLRINESAVASRIESVRVEYLSTTNPGSYKQFMSDIYSNYGQVQPVAWIPALVKFQIETVEKHRTTVSLKTMKFDVEELPDLYWHSNDKKLHLESPTSHVVNTQPKNLSESEPSKNASQKSLYQTPVEEKKSRQIQPEFTAQSPKIPLSASPTARLYIHIGDESQRAAAQEIGDKLEEELSHESVDVRRIILVDDIKFNSSFRYFKRENYAQGNRINNWLNQAQIIIPLKDLSNQYQNNVSIKPGHYEIWLGPEISN